jgi:GxxExxY protein
VAGGEEREWGACGEITVRCAALVESFRFPGHYRNSYGDEWDMNTDNGGCSDELSERVIGAIFEVANTLGAGFLEKVYERALVRELEMRGVRAAGQASMPVVYKGKSVGEYFADILVEGEMVVELKCVERLVREHVAQCMNYLRASGKKTCLLVNFEKPKVEWRRVVCEAGVGESVG